MLISFFNPSDLIGCGWALTNQIHSGTWRGMQRGYAEGVRGGVCGGGMQRGYVEGVQGGGT